MYESKADVIALRSAIMIIKLEGEGGGGLLECINWDVGSQKTLQLLLFQICTNCGYYCGSERK